MKPILSSRCLIAPASLSDPSTVFLHRQTYKIAKHHPRYFSVFDVMTYEDGVRGPLEWTQFLDHLTKWRVYIIEDVDMDDEDMKDEDMKLSISSIETLIYDLGIKGPNDETGVDFYKGECDASFVKNTATLSYFIWKGDVVVFSEIYQNVQCKSASEAEVYAAFALLSKAKDLKILKLLVYSDCEAVSKIISGQLIIDKGHKERNTYLMLRSMKRHFSNLIAAWKPRELMVFPDHIGKVNISDEGKSLITDVMERCSSYLKGLPVFRIEHVVAGIL